jgi:hypothetical protein
MVRSLNWDGLIAQVRIALQPMQCKSGVSNAHGSGWWWSLSLLRSNLATYNVLSSEPRAIKTQSLRRSVTQNATIATRKAGIMHMHARLIRFQKAPSIPFECVTVFNKL